MDEDRARIVVQSVEGVGTISVRDGEIPIVPFSTRDADMPATAIVAINFLRCGCPAVQLHAVRGYGLERIVGLMSELALAGEGFVTDRKTAELIQVARRPR